EAAADAVLLLVAHPGRLAQLLLDRGDGGAGGVEDRRRAVAHGIGGGVGAEARDRGRLAGVHGDPSARGGGRRRSVTGPPRPRRRGLVVARVLACGERQSTEERAEDRRA